MEYSPEQWARMRDNAMRAAFDMQRKAQLQGNLSLPPINKEKQRELPKFYRAEYSVERYSGNRIEALDNKTNNPPVHIPSASDYLELQKALSQAKPQTKPLPEKKPSASASLKSALLEYNNVSSQKKQTPQNAAPPQAQNQNSLQNKQHRHPTQKKPSAVPAPQHDDTGFLLSLILLLRQEGADSLLISMLIYILL